MSITHLQEIGLNKYEAQAYSTLLNCGPLTGYELGKRSQVPASRCYDVLERLCQRGLALIQPGEPVRYRALEPALFLNRVRTNMEEALAALAGSLTHTQQPGGEFWVVRGQAQILASAQALCASASQTLWLALPTGVHDDFAVSLAQAGRRDVHLSLSTEPDQAVPTISLLVDAREALLGTLTPDGQAILSQNPALLALLTGFFRQMRPQAPPPVSSHESDWLDWEQRKQQRLRTLHTYRSIA
ncbi:MAG TPA: helix-turn-helix domain-containing protein [Ktedonobacteraceae bacterium]|jgi:sugar-specific transcriptional regulator TrmB